MRSRLQTAITATIILIVATAGESRAVVNSYTEDFTTLIHRDSANTTAYWNRFDGELELYPFTARRTGFQDTAGNAEGVFVAGNYAYVADGSEGLQVIDISDPAAPFLAGGYDTAGISLSVSVAGDHAYVADRSAGLIVLDITDPTAPVLVGSRDTPGAANDVFIDGDIAHVADGAAGLQMIDITDPTNPVIVGSYDTAGNAIGVVVSGDIAYVADNGERLQVIDVSDPTAPTLVTNYVAGLGFLRGVHVDGNWLYGAGGSAGLHIIDITNPAAPNLTATVNTFGYSHSVHVAGNRAYVADGNNGLAAIDVSDPSAPALEWDFPRADDAKGVYAAGDFVYIAIATAGLELVKVKHVQSPNFIANDNSSNVQNAIVVSGDHAFTADGFARFNVFDISNPANPVHVGNAMTQGDAHSVFVSGDNAFVGSNRNLAIFDISDPTTPTLLGTYTIAVGTFFDIYVHGDYAYIVGSLPDLHVVDISDATNPTLATVYNLPFGARGVVGSGDNLFVASLDGGLSIVDISNPIAPTPTGSVVTPDAAWHVAVSGDCAYVADRFGGLQVINIADVASPWIMGSFDSQGDSKGIHVDGKFAFLASQTSGLHVLDVEDPSNPLLVGNYDGGSGYRDVHVAGDYAFAAGRTGGLDVIQVFHTEKDVANDTGQSLIVDNGDDEIVRARLTSTESTGVSWELSADGGNNFQPVLPDNGWNSVVVGGNDLIWRSTLTWSPGEAPTVFDVQIDWLNEFPVISAISDIPNDQGKQVSVEWTRSGYDFVGDPDQIVEYAVYRKIDQNLKSGDELNAVSLAGYSQAVRSNATAMKSAGWHFIAAVPVRAEDEYAVVAPTLADSTISSGQYFSTFMVSALTATPGMFFDSPPDSGYSVDNLAPSVPANFTLAYHFGSGNALGWDASSETDFQYFSVYRSNDPSFVPMPHDLVHSTTSLGWIDPDYDGVSVYYKVTATDASGNESDGATAGTVTAAPHSPVSGSWELQANVPNPFNPKTAIRFNALIGGAAMSLRVYDVRGRLITTLVSGTVAPGAHTIMWNGRNDIGQSVASGVYFYRLKTEAYDETKKMLLSK